jgi:hypothetical protein
MKRKFTISIKPTKQGVVLPDDLAHVFGCYISEAGEVESSSHTKERKLTFIDEKGNELNSDVFEDLAFFYRPDDVVPEEHEIQKLICTKLDEVYHLDSSDVLVEVSSS